MDIIKVFRGISKKLYADFEISSNINHKGTMGDFRENALREFLLPDRLPKRYGVGNGEIVGHVSNVSKQSDLIIFDQLDSIPLLYDNEVQVYPIDCIYGIIEVKSQLSKPKLVEGLENIKSVKELTPNDYVTKKMLSISQQYKRPKPFGIVFAFSLSGNSLSSLEDNLREWEQINSHEFWPNLIVVLGEGLIYHTENGIDRRILSETITKKCRPTSLSYKDDSFFHFYSYLLDLCNNTELPKVEISTYLDLPQKMGKYIVAHHDRIVRYENDGNIDKDHVYHLTEKFIDKLVVWCKANGSMTFEAMSIKQDGQIPRGLDSSYLRHQVYFYNPDNFPGMHEVKDAITINEKGQAITKEKLSVPSDFVIVDGEAYYYPTAYVTRNDYEPIEGKTVDDL